MPEKKTHCKSGHPFAGDNLLVDGKGVRRCRACRRVRHERWTAKGLVNEATVRLVVAALHEGKTLNNLCGRSGSRYVGGPIVSLRRLKIFRLRNPRFDALVTKLAARNRVARVGDLRTAPRLVLRRRPDADRFVERIAAAVPRNLPRDLRDDAISRMTLAAFEGRLSMDDVERRAREFVSECFREEHNRWGALSLDDVIPGTTTPMVEMIGEDRAMWRGEA